MKSLIKLALVALVLILGYNYFYGDEAEQQQAEKIVGKVKDLGSDIKSLVMNEREKYDEGKYDDAITKFSDLISSVKEKVSNIDLEKLEERKKGIEEAMKKLKKKGEDIKIEDTKEIDSDMENLFDDLKEMIEKIDLE